MPRLRAAIEGQGEGRRERTDFPAVKLDGQVYPVGPCSHCMAGLVVIWPFDDGEVLVRHDDARSFDIPHPPGWEESRVFFGIHPEAPIPIELEPSDPEGGD